MPFPRPTRLLALAAVAGLAAATTQAAAAPALSITRTSSSTIYVDTATFSDTFPVLRAGYEAFRITNDSTPRRDVWVEIDGFTGAVALAAKEDGLAHVGAMAAGETRTVFFYLRAAAASGTGDHTVRMYAGKPGSGGTELVAQTATTTVADAGFANANKVNTVTVGPAGPALGGDVTVVVEGESGTIGAQNVMSFSPSTDLGFDARSFELQSTSITLNGPNTGTFEDTLLIPASALTSASNTPYVATYRFRAVDSTTATTKVSPVGWIASGGLIKHTNTGSFGALPPIQPVSNTVTLAASADKTAVTGTAASRTVTYAVTVTNAGAQPVSFDDVTETMPAGASYVAGSTTWAGAAATDPNVSGRTLLFAAPYAIPASASRTLTYQILLPAGDGTYTDRIVAHSGQTQIDTTVTTADDAPAAITVTEDSTAPSVSITAAPSDPSASRGATFAFASPEPGATFRCAIDGGAAAACTSGRSYAGLADGSHTFTVTAADAAGNTGAASHLWTVDATAPALTVSAAPASPTRTTVALFTYTASEGTVTCALDGAAAAPCVTPVALAGLGEGSHTLVVRAADALGNAATETRTWTVDLTAPVVTLGTVPAVVSADADPDFTFTVDDPAATVTCVLDGGAAAPCAAPLALAGLADGPHTLTVAATDAAGNTGQTSYSWTVDTSVPADTIAPVITVTAAPGALTVDHGAVEYAVDDPSATVTCELDGVALGSCASPLALAGLGDGPHTITLAAEDAAGNVGTEQVDFTVDTAVLHVTATGAPAGAVATDAIDVAVAADDPAATLTCTLDGVPVDCSGGRVTETGLADGPHALVVDAATPGGATARRTLTWTVDTGVPDVAATGPSGTVAGADASVEFTVSDPDAAVTCTVDGAALAGCGSPLRLEDLADGPHTVVVRAVDGAGNADEQVLSFTVDTTPPAVTVLERPAALVASAAVDVDLAVDASAAAVTCTLDGQALASCAAPLRLAGLADGEHVVVVTATDAVGNESVRTVRFTVDTTPPAVAITAAPAGTVATRAATVAYTVSGADLVTCTVDGAAVACALPLALAGLANGPHTVVVAAADAAGNSADDSASWTVDVAAPDVRLTVTDAPAVVSVGRTEHVTLLARNVGAADADHTTVTIDVPAGSELVSVAVQAVDAAGLPVGPGPDCDVAGRAVTCPLATLAPGDGYAITLGLRATAPGSLTIGTAVAADGMPETPGVVPQEATRCTIIGTDGDDVLAGTPGDDVICGLGGDDVLTGAGGRDRVLGGSGSDRMDGGGGADELRGAEGNDRMLGQDGDDVILGTDGRDSIIGGRDDDHMDGGAGDDRIWARHGHDRVLGGAGDDRLDTHDRMRDRIDGGAGVDTWIGDDWDLDVRSAEHRRILWHH